MENYYDVLEIAPSASEEVIRSAYKTLVKKYHPDVYKGDKNYAHQQMLKINEAYEVLSDAEKRRKYDTQFHTDDHQSTTFQESASKATQEPPPYRPAGNTAYTYGPGYSKPKGCLPRLFKFAFTLFMCGIIIYACTRLYNGELSDIAAFATNQWNKLSEKMDSEESSTPLDDKHDEAVANLLREAETTTDNEERLVQFSTALGMEVIELGLKANAYSHYVGENPENKAFYKEQMKLIEETTDLMHKYYSDEEIEAVSILVFSDYFLQFDEAYFDYDSQFGTDWDKQNIDVDALWEMYLYTLAEWANQQPESIG